MSNTQQIETSLKSLILDDDREFVAMFSGEWGIGKTYFWKRFTKNHLKDKDVVYISLFGKNSLADIETEIVTKIYKYNKGLKKYTKHLDTVGNMASKAIGLPINFSIGSLLSLFKASDFKNTIICFDDFERLSDKVHLKDVLGLISQFKEQKECKIIMILNEKELDKLSDIDGKKHNEIFALYKEKVVDYSFHYSPSKEELFAAIKDDIEKITWCDHKTIYNFFEKIDLKNIRIMKQALYLLNYFNFVKNYDLDTKVVNEFVEIALNLFIFKAKSNYIYSEFEEFQYYNRYSYTKKIYQSEGEEFKEEDFYEKSKEKHEKNLNYYLFKKYQSTNKEKIEKNIYNFIDNHTINKEELQNLLKENNQNLSWYDVRNIISETHKRLYTDFSTEHSELVNQLLNLLEKHKDDMHHLFQYKDFKPLIDHINEFLPKESIKSLEREIIKNYIDHDIKSSTCPEESGISPTDFIKKDYEWADKYHKQLKNTTLKIKPNEVMLLMKSIRKEKYCTGDSAYKLGLISFKEYEELIKTNPDFIQTLVDFLIENHNDTNFKNARENITNALISLKKESKEYAWKVDHIANSAEIKLEDENNET